MMLGTYNVKLSYCTSILQKCNKQDARFWNGLLFWKSKHDRSSKRKSLKCLKPELNFVQQLRANLSLVQFTLQARHGLVVCPTRRYLDF